MIEKICEYCGKIPHIKYCPENFSGSERNRAIVAFDLGGRAAEKGGIDDFAKGRILDYFRTMEDGPIILLGYYKKRKNLREILPETF